MSKYLADNYEVQWHTVSRDPIPFAWSTLEARPTLDLARRVAADWIMRVNRMTSQPSHPLKVAVAQARALHLEPGEVIALDAHAYRIVKP